LKKRNAQQRAAQQRTAQLSRRQQRAALHSNALRRTVQRICERAFIEIRSGLLDARRSKFRLFHYFGG